MSIRSFFSASTHRPTKKVRRRASLQLEPLEERCVPTNTISGYVFQDANNNGLMAPGELPVANAAVQLLDASNNVVANAITDSTGAYAFTTENAITPQLTYLTETLTFPSTQPGVFQGTIPQFNPALGTLEGVTISQSGSITSDIAVENISNVSTSTISAVDSGDLNLSLTSTGQTISDMPLAQIVGTYNAAKYAGTFNGVLSFTTPNGTDFGPQTVAGSASAQPPGGNMSPFEGTGNVSLTETATVGSTANGNGGNLIVEVTSTATDTITVTYAYMPSNIIPPGQYTIRLSPQPAGFYPGHMSSNGAELSNPPGDELIPVTVPVTPLDNYTAPNNDFGELLPASVSGYAYVDANDNGMMLSGDPVLANVVVTLTGTNDLGTPITQTTMTNSSGQYTFGNLRPGTYTVNETQPAGYLQGQNSVGQVVGVNDGVLGPNVDQISSIVLAQGNTGVNYNFGELIPGSLSGYVYFDAHNDGVMDSGDPGLANVIVTLMGSNDKGLVNQTATTNSSGYYQFQNLRPGTYTMSIAQPANYRPGQEDAGSLPSTITLNQFAGIGLAQGVNGVNFDFGELSMYADLAIVKTASASSVQVGNTLTYTMTVSNLGPAGASLVSVTDPLPSGTTFISAVGPGWTITNNSNTVTATLPALANGAATFFTITVQVPSYSGTLTNTATVTSATPDNNPSNNTSTAVTLVTDPPGSPFPQYITPQFGAIPIFSKIQLMGGSLAPATAALASDIVSLYLTLTNAAPSASVVSSLVTQIQAGKESLLTLVNQLWLSAQHLDQEVTGVYQSLLGHAPTAAQLQAGVNQLKAGGSQFTVAATVLTSSAFLQAHPTSSSLITTLDEKVLGEVPDLSTVLASVQALGVTTWSAYVQSQLSSQQVYTTLITTAYQGILSSGPTLSQMQTYLSELTNNQISPDVFIQQLLASSTFEQIAYLNRKK